MTDYKAPTQKEIKKFLEVYGEKGRIVRDILEKNLPEINELKTGIGWELVRADVLRMTTIIEKIIKGDATEDERIEAKYLYFTRIPNVVDKLTIWLKGLEAIALAQKQ